MKRPKYHSVGKSRSQRRLQFEILEDRRVLATVPSGFSESIVASDLTSPITMDIEESGRIWLAFQDGRIQVIENDVLLPQIAYQLDCDGSGERGLQGIELDPDFETNHFIYVYYTAASPESHNRLSRLTVDPSTENTILAGSEVILLELPGFSTLPQDTDPIWHMGGAIHFMPDETIAVQIGDHLNNSLVQNNNAPFGKILRVNKDGTAPTDNPFYNPADTNPAGGSDWNGNAPGDVDWIDYLWASGLRNPFSGDIDPATGRYFVNDVGNFTWEEINDATLSGHNFGWPLTEGMFDAGSNPGLTNPFLAYDHGDDCAITGGAFYSPLVSQFPAEYQGQYFFSQFCAGNILVVDPNNPSQIDTFISGAAYPMNIEIASDGSLYYIARGAGAGGAPGVGTGRVYKVQYVSHIGPQIVQHPVDQLVSVGSVATFSASAAGTPPLSYQWQRHNGVEFVDIPDATDSSLTLSGVTLADDDAQIRVVVTNSLGSATSDVATLDVTANTPPTANILLPLASTTYRAGDMINFSATASDLEDGALGAASMTWQIDFHHDTHSHPFFPATSGITSGQFTVPANSETAANVWFRIHLSVTDSAGLTTEVIRDVHPVTSDFSVEANIDGATILVDGQPRVTPYPISGVVNVIRTLEAPLTVSSGEVTGHFVQWLDGETDRLRTISTPENDTAYVALYENSLSSMSFLSDESPTQAVNGWGTIELDKSNGEENTGDGLPMTIGGVFYPKGLGVHAQSDVRYSLGGGFSRFLADVGVDDEVGNNGSVVFQVYGDGILLADSGTRGGNDTSSGQPIRLDVDITGVDELRLVVADAGDENYYDHADWGNARILPVGAGANKYISFQPSGSPTVAGYSVDSGLIYGARGGGLSYGWSTSHTGNVFDRDVDTADDLYETHVTVQANQFWEIALADGTYAVTVSVGDAGGSSEQSTNTVNVEGVSYWNGQFLDNDAFAQLTKLITVSDGRLTMDVGSSTDTSINFIEIIPVAESATADLFPFFAADVNLSGRLTMQDVLEFGTGWGTHSPGLSHEEQVRLGDLDFDGDTDDDDWAILNERWLSEQGTTLDLQAVLTPVAGDYNRSGIVTQDDFDLWTSTFGSQEEMAADGNGDGRISAADYTRWRDNLGASLGSGAGASALVSSEVTTNDPQQPAGRNSISSGVFWDLLGHKSSTGNRKTRSPKFQSDPTHSQESAPHDFDRGLLLMLRSRFDSGKSDFECLSIDRPALESAFAEFDSAVKSGIRNVAFHVF